MAIIKLDIGADVNKSVEQMRKDLTEIVRQINDKPNKVKLGLDEKYFDKEIKGVKVKLDDIRKEAANIKFSDQISTSLTNITSSLGKLTETVAGVSGLKQELMELSAAMKSFQGINLNLGLSGSAANRSAAYGNTARAAISELEQQLTAIEQVYAKFYNMKDASSAAIKGATSVFGLGTVVETRDALGAGNLNEQVTALARYISMLQVAANHIQGLNLSGVNAQFERSATEIMHSVERVASGEVELDNNTERLKGIFGSGINSEQLIGKLEEIRAAIDGIVESLANLNAKEIKIKFDDTSLENIRAQISQILAEMSTVTPKTTRGSGGGGGSYEQENYLKQIASTATSARKLLNDNLEASSSTSYDKLRVNLEYLEAVLEECGGDASNLDAVFNRLGGNAESAILRINSAMATLKNELQSSGTSGGTSLQQMMSQYNQMNSLLKNNSSLSGTDEYKNLSSVASKFNAVIKNCKGDASELAAELKSVGLNGSTAMSEAKSAMLSFKTVVTNTTAEEKKMKEAERESAAETKKVTTTQNNYNNAVVEGEKKLRAWSAAEHSKNQTSREAYQRIVDSYTAMKGAKKEYDSGAGSIENLKAKTDAFRSTLKSSEAVIRTNGDATQSLTDKIGSLATKFGSWLTVSQVIMYAIRTVKQMVSTSVELDTAMTQMQIVTKATADEMEQFGNKAAAAAQKTASSIKDIISSSTTYARLGYSSDESVQLAQYTAMLQNVGDIDVSDAQDAVTAIVKAYKKDASEIEDVMDKLVVAGNNFPISVSQIAEGMNNASSTLAASGNSFEQSIALLTAANTTIQDASKSSTGLRTIAARIRNVKTELDELGETMTKAEYDDLVSQLTNAGVKITDSNGELRGTYDIFADIAEKSKELGANEQAALATALSGTRQQAVYYSLVNNFKEAQGAMEAMTNSAGTLDTAYSTYLDSTQAKTNQLKATFEDLSSNVFNSNALGGGIDFLNGILTVINKITESGWALPPLIAAIASSVLSLKNNFGRIKRFILITNMPKAIIVLSGYEQFRYCQR